MTRKNGFYWIEYNGTWIVAEYYGTKWFVTGNSIRCEEELLTEIDETPIERIPKLQIQNTSQTLATLKETLSDFPDTLLVAKVYIEMHNKFSIQITEYNVEQKEGN